MMPHPPFRLLLLTVTIALALCGPVAAEPRWTLDTAHSSVSFSVAHMGVSRVRGDFTDFSGSGRYDGADIGSASVEAVVRVASVDTRNAKRDEHLKGADFFDAQQFPTISFTSKRFRRTSGQRFQLTGDLTIHGVTRTVVLGGEFSPVIKDTFGKTRVGAQASTTINRKDFGLTWSRTMESGGLLVGEEVEITLAVEFVRE